MGKRTFLKTLAFLAGLYFVLNFFLPEKLGGDFDGYEVRAPAPVLTADGPLVFYAGLYSDRLPAIGRLVVPAADAGAWVRQPDGPVLQRSVFVPDDQAGMLQLDAVAGPGGLHLFYVGLDRDHQPTLCHAAGNAAGTQWQKQPPVHFRASQPPAPAQRPELHRNGVLPGALEFFAADRTPDGAWQFVLLLKTTGKGTRPWLATGTDLSDLRLADAPLAAAEVVPPNTTAFDARPSGDGFDLYFTVGNELVTVALRSAAAPTPQRRELVPAETKLTGLRLGPDGGTAYVSTSAVRTPPPAPEFASQETRILAADLAGDTEPRVLREPGAAPVPTYLGRGTQAAGTFLQIIGTMALFIAVINLSLFHGKNVLNHKRGWPNSVIFFIFLIGMFVVTLLGKGESGSEAAETAWGLTYNFLFQGIVQAMGTAVFSMITFFMISAAYRSFRVRSLEAALLMCAACVVMIGQMPLGELLGSYLPESLFFLRLPWLSQKLLTVINACAYRGVLIGLTVGGLSIAIRIWLGMDNSVYSGLEGKS